MNFLLLSNYAIDAFLPIAKWLAIGAIAFLTACLLILYLINKDKFAKTVKPVLFALFIFLLCLGLTCMVMEILKSFSASYTEEKWLDREALLKYVLIPLSSLAFIILCCAIVLFITSKKAKERLLLTLKICGAICLIALLICGILLAVFYNYKYANDGYYNSDVASVNQPVLYIAVALVTIVVLALAFILDKDNRPLNTRCIALAGVTIAMSFGLSYVKLFEMPQGGSITLFSLLPIMIFSYAYGTKKGVLVCFIYGLLQAVQDPWLIHPAQFFLDYPVAFSAIGLSGALSKPLSKYPSVALLSGGILAGVLRFFSHLLSGVFAFSAYAEGANPWIYSLAYNSFVFVDLAITLAVGMIVFSSKAFIKELNKN